MMKKLRLVLIIVAIGTVLSACSVATKMNNVNNEEFKALMQGDYLLLDVRTQEEYDAGHIDDAQLIPVSELESRIDEITDYKDKTVLVYCRSGNRSVTASNVLLENGFTNVYNLKNGYSSWVAEIIK